jgi:hypothetical protein
LAGGAGGVGAGIYEAEKHHDRASGAGKGAVTGERGVIGSESNPYSSSALDPRVDSPGHRKSGGLGSQPSRQDQHHYGRDAAVVGGVGAAGAGVYEEQKHIKHGQDSKSVESYQDQRAIPHHPAQAVDNNSKQPAQEHHTGRDAAAIGTLGAAGAGAEHEFSKKDAEKREKEAAKAEKKHEKEVEKEHKPSLISRILHRNKDKSDDDEPATKSSRHHEEEAAIGAGAVGTGVAAHEHKKLHKDPPKSHQPLGDSTTTGGQHMGTDGPIGDPNKVSGLQ